MSDYPFKINECCCHAALFLWQLQHFMNMGCLSNTVAMATVTFLLRLWLITPSKLINVVAMQPCFYANSSIL